jgi:DNA recombination protein RmuC
VSEFIAGLAIGAALGGGIAWGMGRLRVQAIRDRAKADVIADRATLMERLQGQTEQIHQLQKALQARDQQLDRLQSDLRQAASHRAAAEAEAAQIPTLQEQVQAREQQVQEWQRTCADWQSQCRELQTRLHQAEQATVAQQRILEQAQAQLTDTFKALSADALRRNSHSFMQLAETLLGKFQTQAQGDLSQRQQAIATLVQPLQTSLERVDSRLQELETARVAAYSGLTEQVKALALAQSQLQGETANLVKALRSPTVRGRWGEIQLQRVVELAGMVDYCDFSQQTTVQSDTGRLRPDMVIRLPSGRNIVVDAKAPLQGYLEAVEAVGRWRSPQPSASPRPPNSHPPESTGQQGLLGTISARAGICGAVFAGGNLFQRRPRTRPQPDRVWGRSAGNPRHPHHPDCPAEGGGLRLATGTHGRKRPAY